MIESRPPVDESQMPYALTPEHLATAPKPWVINEVLRLRRLLDDCWAAAGLLGPGMTGQPFQAWEEPSDLVRQIEQLASDASNYREAEAKS